VTETFRSKENFVEGDGWLAPEPPAVPAVLSTVTPATAPGGVQTLFTATGTDFTPTTKMRVGTTTRSGTVYVSPTELNVLYQPANVAMTLQWTVIDGDVISNTVTSEITLSAEA
jgi:hypothetical protein